MDGGKGPQRLRAIHGRRAAVSSTPLRLSDGMWRNPETSRARPSMQNASMREASTSRGSHTPRELTAISNPDIDHPRPQDAL